MHYIIIIFNIDYYYTGNVVLLVLCSNRQEELN